MAMIVLNNETISSLLNLGSLAELIDTYKIVGEDDHDYNGQICDLEPELLAPLIKSLNSLIKPRYASNLLTEDGKITLLGKICIVARDYYNDLEFKNAVENKLLNEGWRKIVEYNNSSFKFDEGGKHYEFLWESRIN